MYWDRIKKLDYFKAPKEHILATGIVPIKEYDILYENQNNTAHEVWEEFYKKFKIKFTFYKDLRNINIDKEIICLWFFKDRGDLNPGNDIQLGIIGDKHGSKIIRYYPNTFFITKLKTIKILEREKSILNRPVLQLDLSEKEYDKIIKSLRQLIRDLPR